MMVFVFWELLLLQSTPGLFVTPFRMELIVASQLHDRRWEESGEGWLVIPDWLLQKGLIRLALERAAVIQVSFRLFHQSDSSYRCRSYNPVFTGLKDENPSV